MKKTRKAVSFITTAALLVTMGTSAFAATPTASDAVDNAVSFTKAYTVTAADAKVPVETVTFTATPDAANPDTTNITVDNLTVNGNDTTYTVTADLPSYTKVGVYKYTITENAGSSQGVTYATGSIDVQVLVSYDNDGNLKAEAGVAADGDGNKNDGITNTYNAGKLEVSKEVTGNLGDKQKVFNATVTFTADKTVNSTISYTDDGEAKTIAPDAWVDGKATAAITVKDGETVTFTNIPEGVTYEVVEAEANQDGYTTTLAYSDETAKQIANNDADTVKITNNKGADINTGINTQSIAYLIVLAGVLAAAVVMVARRRRSN